MRLLFRLTALVLVVTALPTLRAQEPDSAVPAAPSLGLSPQDAAELLAKLHSLQDELAANTKEVVSAALDRIRAASANESAAADLYLAAWKIIHIDRSSSPPSQTRGKEDWRSQQMEWLRETGAPKAIRLQLAWLHLIIEASRADASARAALLPKARTLAKEAAAVAVQLAALPSPAGSAGGDRRGGPPGGGSSRERMEAMRERLQGGGGPGRGSRSPREASDFLTQSVMASLFAQAYHLQNHIQLPAGWSAAPLDLDAVYDRMLLPDARASRPSELPILWDERIQMEAALQRAALSETAFADWGASQGRHLQWRKNLDLLQSGVNARAAGEELIKLFRENPAHPHRNAWRKDLEKITATLSAS